MVSRIPSIFFALLFQINVTDELLIGTAFAERLRSTPNNSNFKYLKCELITIIFLYLKNIEGSRCTKGGECHQGDCVKGICQGK